jgi:outer membrane receptor protein involved in Fe transport
MDFNITYTRSAVDLSIGVKKSYNLIGEWTNYITINDKSKLVVGALFNQIHGKETTSMLMNGDSIGVGRNLTSGLVIAEGTKNNLALYAQLDYQLRENLKLIGGSQVNKADGIDVNVVPRAGVIWYPIPRINVKALYSSAFRAPSICELYSKIGDKIGAPDLNPEKVTTLDLGVSYQGEQSQFGVNVFHSKMTDIITTTLDMPTDNSSASIYGNNDIITFKGIECNGAYYLNRSLYVTASVLYQNNESDTVKSVSYVANLGAKAGISYVWEKGITVSLFDIYQGGMDDKYAGNLGSGSNLAYNLVHLHSKFNINNLLGWGFKPSLSLYVDVNDCFDKKYYFLDQQGGNPTVANPGREIYVGLTVAL